jgi:NAD(P)-dependent dehydrogenase (short-subunit alcohol dehydrogenase family)
MTAAPVASPSGRSIAVVVGAGGGLGSALAAHLAQDARWAAVLPLGRQQAIRIDYADEASLAEAAASVAGVCTQEGAALRLLVVASGFLHGEREGQPERSFRQIDAGYLRQVFAINTLGPALVMKHFLPLLPLTGRCVAGFVSARVGSIADNALGGWYGYRASKSALNQLVKTASVELARRNRDAVCVALHPGTVDTALSRPFAKTGLAVRPAGVAAAEVLQVMEQLQPADSGGLFDQHGARLPY